MRFLQTLLASMAALVLFVACGSDAASEQTEGSTDRPVVVATTNILGDVVENLAGDAFDVVVIMPIGADPHDFQPSARQVATIESAGAIIANGAGFEEGLLDAVDAAESRGALVFEAMSAIQAIENGEEDHDDDHGDDDHDDHADDDHDDDHADHGDDDHDDDHDDHGDDDHDDDHADHDDEDDDDHADKDHGDEDDHEHHHDSGGQDPHFFTDPVRMAQVVDGIADFLAANVDGIDQDALQTNAAQYIAELESLDAEVEAILAVVPESHRVLVTNHEVFGYFADRYDFEVVGTVIPTGSSSDGVSGQRLAALAALLEEEAVSAVFTDMSSSDELAQTLAREVGDIDVVSLFSESLGDQDSGGASYVDMVRSNAMRIADALAG